MNQLLLAYQVINSAFEQIEGGVVDLTNNLWKKIAKAVDPQSEEEARALLCLLRDAMGSSFEFELTRTASRWSRERFRDPREVSDD